MLLLFLFFIVVMILLLSLLIPSYGRRAMCTYRRNDLRLFVCVRNNRGVAHTRSDWPTAWSHYTFGYTCNVYYYVCSSSRCIENRMPVRGGFTHTIYPFIWVKIVFIRIHRFYLFSSTLHTWVPIITAVYRGGLKDVH